MVLRGPRQRLWIPLGARQLHHRHYGKWKDEAGLEEAVARAMGVQAKLPK
jgi:23S rRNA G2445 N2-methylase RlmL